MLIEPKLELRGEDGHGDAGGMAGTVPGSVSMPTCPFARQGLDSRLMSSCPGYRPEAVSFAGLGAGESLGERLSCHHLGTQRAQRGYVSACRHPDGLPAGAAQLAGRVRRARGLAGN